MTGSVESRRDSLHAGEGMNPVCGEGVTAGYITTQGVTTTDKRVDILTLFACWSC